MTTKREDRRETSSVEEAAERLGIGRNQAYQAVRRGELPHIRIGKRVLILNAALDRLLAGAESTMGS
ncbi:helix-turn-helix domain-containing protein [Rhizobium leguminosarum]|uniref:helix-turn-helix domain-containing protein n=1 Tax=Rhizobium ruizarguesonis TaxID=2081791 RepID=UPI0013DED9CA|nr:helix-turn-helix domain-containing protein [Rhizobium ruizarguesonis]MBY5849722.1 helix-turn-helix domain-containing protein [Rhizobium leguminosarum]NEJ86400.1 helix-turn-helix domain-containing protein [Rhizobium ruizarguesonis]